MRRRACHMTIVVGLMVVGQGHGVLEVVRDNTTFGERSFAAAAPTFPSTMKLKRAKVQVSITKLGLNVNAWQPAIDEKTTKATELYWHAVFTSVMCAHKIINTRCSSRLFSTYILFKYRPNATLAYYYIMLHYQPTIRSLKSIFYTLVDKHYGMRCFSKFLLYVRIFAPAAGCSMSCSRDIMFSPCPSVVCPSVCQHAWTRLHAVESIPMQ